MRMVNVSVGGQRVHLVGNISPQQQSLLAKRATFVELYCKDKGWSNDINKLTMAQITEIREQPGWQNPT